MKTIKIFLAIAIFTGAAAYARAVEGAGMPAAPGSSVVVSTAVDTEKLSTMSLDTLKTRIKAAKDNNERRQYVGAVYRFKPKTEKDIATLANLAAEDGGKGVASEAAFRSMGNVGPEDKALAPAFVKLLGHKNGRVQYVAMEKCGLLRSKEALPKMIKGLKSIDKNASSKDDEWRIRGLIVGLGKYGKDSLAELLKLRKESKDGIVQHFAEGAIKTMDDKNALPQFMEIVRNKNEEIGIKSVAIEMVGKLGVKDSLEELISIYKQEKNRATKIDLIYALAKSKSENALPFLETLLQTETYPTLRSSAITAIERIGGPKAIDILTRAFETEKESSLRMDIAYSLKQLTGKDYDWRKTNEK